MAVRPGPHAARSVWRYLPLAVCTTALVIALPALLVAVIVPRGGVLLIALSALSAVALSSAFAAIGAALWKRRVESRDIIFADLMLWGWLRRCWTEQRLTQARELYDSARKAGPTVSIELLESLSKLLEARDAYTYGHSQRVARHASRIARAMHLSPVEIAKIRTAAVVHDVGKLYTPREILNNPERLTDAEFAVIMRHPAEGEHMLAAVGDPEIAAMVRHHHERLDGHGYPDGLAGSEIPLGARIIAVADTFDAITSSRAYRSADTQKKALDILAKEGGSQLDPVAVAAFLGCYSSRRSVAWCAFATSIPQRILEGLQTVPATLGISSGVSTILPALGAAGLLTLSHGVRPNTPVDQRQGASITVARAATLRAATPTSTRKAPTTTGTSAHGTGRIGGAQGPLRHSAQSHKTQPNSPSVPAHTISTAGGPSTAAGAPPVAATPTTPPKSTSPVPTPPAPTPPTSSVPQLPIPNPPVASNPPVTLPSVSTPTVSTPSVSTPVVTTPGITVPSVTLPSVTVPNIKVPSASIP
jgi:HD-GYP domain-containing protein (c-di-GMP phosphodiesterase class II)